MEQKLSYKTQVQQIRKLKKDEYLMLRRLCFHAARMYNYGLYLVRQKYFQSKEFLKYNSLYHLCKENENYKILPAVIAQQTLIEMTGAFSSALTQLEQKKQGLYKKRVNLPHYLDKEGFYTLTIPKNGFQIKGNQIYVGLSRLLQREQSLRQLQLRFPPHIDASKVVELRIVPQHNAHYFLLEIVYEVENQEYPREENLLSIDIGLDNLLTCFDTHSNRPFIISGRTIKAINHYWNKRNARLQSIKDKQQISSQTRQQFLLARTRHNRIQDYLKKAGHYVVSYCVTHHIGKVVVGHNRGWKQQANLGKKNNQNFVQVPFSNLLQYIHTKCQQFGILYQEIGESHTSKCSFLDMEPIEHHDEYAGKRVHRGLFRTATGILLNADVNASANIYRKVSGDYSCLSGDRVRGLVANPVRITLV